MIRSILNIEGKDKIENSEIIPKPNQRIYVIQLKKVKLKYTDYSEREANKNKWSVITEYRSKIAGKQTINPIDG